MTNPDTLVDGSRFTLFCLDRSAKDLVATMPGVRGFYPYDDGERVDVYTSPLYDYEEVWLLICMALEEYFASKLDPTVWGEWANEGDL